MANRNGQPELPLVERARCGDRDARRRVVEEHMGLVRSLARRYRDLGLPVEDLTQEGAIGLLEAIDAFDAGKGASFPTYAYWRIRRAIGHALTDHGRLLRLPKSILEHRRALADATAALVNAGRRPTPNALAEAAQLSVAEVAAALEAPSGIASLDDDGIAIADPAAADPSAEAVSGVERAALHDAIGHLSARQRTVIEDHFGLGGEPRTLAEIADDLHLSTGRVRAIESDAMHDLALELEDAIAV